MNKQVWRSGSAFGFQPESLGPIPSTCNTKNRLFIRLLRIYYKVFIFLIFTFLYFCTY